MDNSKLMVLSLSSGLTVAPSGAVGNSKLMSPCLASGLTVAHIRDSAIGHALSHGLFYCNIGYQISLSFLTLKFYRTVIIWNKNGDGDGNESGIRMGMAMGMRVE